MDQLIHCRTHTPIHTHKHYLERVLAVFIHKQNTVLSDMTQVTDFLRIILLKLTTGLENLEKGNNYS